MKLRGILVVLACLAVTGSGAALADATNGAATSPIINGDAVCAGAPLPEIAVTVTGKDPVEDHSLGYAKLSQIESGNNKTAASRGRVAFGLTSRVSTGEIGGVTVTGQAMPDGRYCVWIGTAVIGVTWEYRVRIAREIKPGSCPERAVREHEAKHVALARQMQPQLQQRLSDSLRQPGSLAMLTSEPYLAQPKLEARLAQILKQVTAAFTAEQDRLELAIDTPQEYARVQNVCGKPVFDALLKR
jgi:hypothetical protein